MKIEDTIVILDTEDSEIPLKNGCPNCKHDFWIHRSVNDVTINGGGAACAAKDCTCEGFRD